MLGQMQLAIYIRIISLAMGIAARRRKGRATHPYGVGATGRLKIVEQPAFPPHAFFQRGREWPVTLRHAQVGAKDDAASDVRSASLRLALPPDSSPLDLVMNTGDAGTFWDLPTFLAFMRATAAAGDIEAPGDKAPLAAFYKKYPLAEQTTANRLRRAPESFTRLYYHSQTVYRYLAVDGTLYYVKYRLIPADRGADSGLLDDEDRRHIWLQARRPDETRPLDYLRQEFKQRLAQAPVHYLLQMQLHRPVPGESAEIFNSCRPWSVAWLDLATVTLDRLLPDEQTESLRFSVGHQPEALGLLPATSPRDYNAINYARARAYQASQKVRG